MSAVKEVGVPFPISLVTEPAQPGLADFVVRRYEITPEDPLNESTDITGIVDIDEFVETVDPYTETITVATERLRGHERISIAGDVSGEIQEGHRLAIGSGVYVVRKVSVDAEGNGYVDFALPLRETINAGDSVARAGNTGRYRITVREDNECSVQYNVSSALSMPEISEDTPVVSVQVGGGDDAAGAVVDNSKLLL